MVRRDETAVVRKVFHVLWTWSATPAWAAFFAPNAVPSSTRACWNSPPLGDARYCAWNEPLAHHDDSGHDDSARRREVGSEDAGVVAAAKWTFFAVDFGSVMPTRNELHGGALGEAVPDHRRSYSQDNARRLGVRLECEGDCDQEEEGENAANNLLRELDATAADHHDHAGDGLRHALNGVL